MEVDRRAFLATLGVGTVGIMSHEDRAESLEHYMMDELDNAISPPKPTATPKQQDGPRVPAGRAGCSCSGKSRTSPCRPNPPCSISSRSASRRPDAAQGPPDRDT